MIGRGRDQPKSLRAGMAPIGVAELGRTKCSSAYGSMDIPERAQPRHGKVASKAQTCLETRLMGKQRKEHPQDNVFVNKPFIEEFSDWVDSPEGELWTEIGDALEDLLKDVQLDAEQRQFIWPDADRLDIEQSVQRIHKQYPEFPRDKIEEFLIDWIDMGYAPENYSQAQLDELDRLTERWVADHMRRAKIAKKGKRTRHS
jgi:hypothetical protein